MYIMDLSIYTQSNNATFIKLVTNLLCEVYKTRLNLPRIMFQFCCIKHFIQWRNFQLFLMTDNVLMLLTFGYFYS
jgi:hypothetical protein